MAVRVERDGPVTVVILDRPERRNAVDGPTAAALAGAFRAFDADPGAHAAVLWGAGGTFCAGADLKAIGGPDRNRTESDGDGPTPGSPWLGGSNSPSGVTCASPRRMPSSASSAGAGASR